MKKWATVGIFVFVFYVASYVPLSWAGRYQATPKAYIGHVYWHPKGVVNELPGKRPALNVLGNLYYPMIAVDWALVHKPYHRC